MAEFARVDIIVFDGISRAQHGGPFQTGDGFQHLALHLLGQRGGNAVGIDGGIIEAFGLEKNLVAGAVGETHHFVLDGRAIARPDAFDLPRIEWRAVEIGADQIVGR